MLFIVLFGLLVYMNARLASQKGMNPLLWSFISVVAFFAAYMLLGAMYVMAFYKGTFAPFSPEAFRAWMMQPLNVIMLFMLGAGGILIIRYVLERQPPQQ